MKRFLTLMAISVCSLMAQRAETIAFRATMLPSNEVPAININASGTATMLAHVVRNAAGQIISGTVDFNVNYAFPGEVEITGLHIHRGAAGVNGPVTITSGLSGTVTIKEPTGRGNISRPGQVRPDDAAALATLRDMIDNPADFYVNLHTTVNPGGVIRSQLKRADMVNLITELSPLNEVPAITDQKASGVVGITALRTFDATGKMESAQVIFRANYTFDRQVTMTGFHIHNGPAGVNAGVVVNTGVTSLPSTATGVGSLLFPVDVDVTRDLNVSVMNMLFDDPASTYANIHTTEFPSGIMRGQLHRTDEMVFNMLMLPSNEVPPIPIDASAVAQVRVNSLRNEAGDIKAAIVTFDSNYRFPDAVTFTGFHIHNQVAGQNGPVIINTGLNATNTVVSDSGFGNIYIPVLVSDAAGLATLNSMVATPDQHYINLHTTVNGGGVVREQIAPAYSKAPAIGAATSGAGPANKSVAPGGLMSIFGERFTYTPSDYLAGTGTNLPVALNGAGVTVGGVAAPIVRVAPWQIDVQVPNETAPGNQQVVVKNAAGASTSFAADVQRVAPAIFAYGNDEFGVIAKLSDTSLVSADNPATTGDVLLVLSTGLGPTIPSFPTGRFIPDGLFPTGAISATVAGRAIPGVTAVAYPGVPGYYVVIVPVIPGIPSGQQTVQLTMGGQTSNTVKVWMK